MIRKLKIRFIVLAMVSLTVLLSVIVAGMNIINYNTVVSDADDTLRMLSDNHGRLPVMTGERLDFMFGEESPEYDDIDAETSERGSGGRMVRGSISRMTMQGSQMPGMSRDEAEETRYFTVLLNSDGEAVRVYTDRIYSVDEDEARTYAADVAASGKTTGFVDDLRYSVVEEDSYTRVTFLDCGRTLGAFKDFLKTSILMSLAGLAAVFAVICYFAGRIVKPVAESYDKQKRFITDAGHEIKTPLTIIKANIDVMRMDLEDAEGSIGNGAGCGIADDSRGHAGQIRQILSELAGSLEESLGDIDGQVDRLTSLTNDLVYLSRMEENGGGLTMTDVPVSDIVRETAESFNAVAVERKKTLAVDVQPMLSMKGSNKELEKLVSILVENALKYSPEGDVIGVSLKKEARNIVLEVKNKSVNQISDEDLTHVFDRFYRTDRSRSSATGGHGIGLSMAHAITAAHGGRIRAHRGDGTEFVVTAAMPV